MDEFDETVFQKYKDYILSNSKYNPKVKKYYSNSSAYFPYVSFEKKNEVDSDYSTMKNIDRSEKRYYTINIYAKNKIDNKTTIPSQVIVDEIRKLTIEFFRSVNFKKTLDTPTPNADTEIFRQTMNYQCLLTNRIQIIKQ